MTAQQLKRLLVVRSMLSDIRGNEEIVEDLNRKLSLVIAEDIDEIKGKLNIFVKEGGGLPPTE